MSVSLPRPRAIAPAISFIAAGLGVAAGLAMPANPASAQVPANIESELQKIGRIVDPACTAKLYRPLMPANDINSDVTPLYPGIRIERNQSFGPAPKDVVDIYSAEKGPKSRPVLIYVPGGSGEKTEIQVRESNAFYDNIGRWATKNGMVAVTMQRHASATWDGGARDISQMIQWVQANIATYHGNPERMFIWAHSAGNLPLGTYIGHPELYGPKGVGVKGVVFISAGGFNIAPAAFDAPRPADMMKLFGGAGKSCGAGGPGSTDGALPGRAAGQPGGPPGGATAGPPPGAGPGGPPDAAAQLAQSSLPELKKTGVKLMLVNGEYDMFTDTTPGHVMPFNQALHDELCKDGPARCPPLLVAKGHSHMSVVFAFDTPDTTVSAPILAWMKKIK